jgi:hypothetical protein
MLFVILEKLNMLFAILKFTCAHSHNPSTPKNNNNDQQGLTNSKSKCPKNKCIA